MLTYVEMVRGTSAATLEVENEMVQLQDLEHHGIGRPLPIPSLHSLQDVAENLPRLWIVA